MKEITPELLINSGWKKIGGSAWYRNSAKLTYVNGIWEVWRDKISKEVKTIEEL